MPGCRFGAERLIRKRQGEISEAWGVELSIRRSCSFLLIVERIHDAYCRIIVVQFCCVNLRVGHGQAWECLVNLLAVFDEQREERGVWSHTIRYDRVPLF